MSTQPRRRRSTGVRRRLALAAAGVVVVLSATAALPFGQDAEAIPPAATATATTTPAPPSATPQTSAAAAPTTPTLGPEWTPLIDQGFDTPAALGEFADVYPGWAGYDGWTDTGGGGLYDSDRVVSVSDGILDERLHVDDGQILTVSITPVPHVQTYGRYEVRFRADEAPGWKIAWLLWPADDDWDQGEIDFPESGLYPGDLIEGFSHRADGTDGAVTQWGVATYQTARTWHTAVIEWRPGSITFRLDDKSWTTTDPLAIPTVPMFWSMQTETYGVPTADTVGHVQIDHVKAWSYTPATGG